MKVSSISPAYSAEKQMKKINKSTVVSIPQTNTRMNMISFKSGNPKHLFHQISELTLFGQGAGGVGTIGNDLFYLYSDFDKIIQNIPLYNQDVIYKEITDPITNKVIGVEQNGVRLRKIPSGLPDGHPFKNAEGSVFTTNKTIKKDANLVDFLKENENFVFVLDEISSSKMDWGLESNVPIGMYRARKDDKLKTFLRGKGWHEDMIDKIDITFTYVDSTASMAKPYADGSYATATGTDIEKAISANWAGKPYTKEAKAAVELMPALKEKMGFDPAHIMCHDGQAMPLIQFAAAKNAAGDSYWKDKSITAVAHNLGDGYLYSLSAKDILVCLANKPEDIRKIIESKEYIEALQTGREEEFLMNLVPKEFLDGRGQSNAGMIAISYAEKGYVPMITTVSNGYWSAIIKNEELSPAMYKRLKNLSSNGHFRGILNVLMDPNVKGTTTNGLPEYYKSNVKLKLNDNSDVEIPVFKHYNKGCSLEDMREVKRCNKISLFKRLDKNLADSQLYSGNNLLERGSGFSAAVTGTTGKNFKLIGGIDKKYIEKLERGEDVPLFVSWGRGDFQKGMDTSLEAFIKFVEKTENKDAIYIWGGDMTNTPEVVELTEKIIQKDRFKGRILGLNGWTPGSSFASAADYSILCSRFAPCELTDLESMHKGCIPIVPKVQGMDQKVFDPDSREERQCTNGYKGKHEYYMKEEDALKAANENAKSKFNEIKNEIINELKEDYKFNKIGQNIGDDLLHAKLAENKRYRKALQTLRDSVISDDIAVAMERAVNDRNTNIAEKIWENHRSLDTTWTGNGTLNPEGKSSAELYKEHHFEQSGKNLSKGEAFQINMSHIHEQKTGGNPLGGAFKNKKTAFIIAGAAIVAAALGYFVSGNLNKNKITQKEDRHLSCVV